MKPGSIILCEPQCWGFEHAPFNAALLDTVLLAYPEAEVVFLGESEHISMVRDRLRRFDEDAETRVEWQEIAIPPRTRPGVLRLASEWHWCRIALEVARVRSASALIVCSITNSGLPALKCLLFLSRLKVPALVVPHSILTTMSGKQPRAPWNWALSLRQVLRLPQQWNLRYVALGETIFRCLEEEQPKIARSFRPLDQPCWMSVVEPEGGLKSSSNIRFGFLGVGSATKGFYRFTRLAEYISARSRNAEFVLAGFLEAKKDSDCQSSVIEGIGYRPLSQQEYERRVSSLTYVVGTSEPAHYRLTASAAFLDGLAYGKPGIYLRNPYLDYYLEQLGDIGYLCDTEEELKQLVLSITNAFPDERYRRQQENILTDSIWIVVPQGIGASA